MSKDQINEIELLKDCLKNGSPVLYVGAGFSYMSQNENGQSIPLASGLCEEIYKHFWDNKNIDDELLRHLNEIRETAQTKCKAKDLKGLCSCFRIHDLSEERNAFLTAFFSGCHISSDDIRNTICQYPWNKIFTVNIDALIEEIYEANSKPLNIWNKDNDDKRHYPNIPSLIKLHGCVRNPDAGYVFDETEYYEFTSSGNYMITEFADSFSKNDVILIGTEFNEDDLKQIISSYAQKGYDAKNEYFFVTPEITDELTRMRVEMTKNMHHIPFTAQQFFEFVKENIQQVDETHNALKAMGLLDIHEIYNTIPAEYVSELYHGRSIQYGDLINGWDISESTVDIIRWVQKDSHNKIISIFGENYVGKTCKAKRVLYDFFCLGYDCYEFSMSSSDNMELFINYINTRNKDTVILFEDAAYNYELLVKKFLNPQRSPTTHRIVIITTDSTKNHGKKYHALQSEHCMIIHVTEKIDNERAELIYNTLNQKHSLSRLMDIPETPNDRKAAEKIKKYMITSNDIIDVLYYSSLGRHFKEHIDKYFISDISQNVNAKKLIGVFCLLNSMGISTVSNYMLSVASYSIGIDNYKKGCTSLSDLLQKNADSYHMRYMRFLSSAYNKELTEDEKYSIILALIKKAAGRFNEGDYNELSALLYKLLNLKALKDVFLSIFQAKKLYRQIEEDCKQYSYYWVQRGLCAQQQEFSDYEEADRFLREARRIRPNSYQVSHAIAKNMIERSLHCERGKIPDAELFFEGINQMQALIEDDKYSKAFTYSLHAYIDSWLKYCILSKQPLNSDVCERINEYVSRINSFSIDQALLNILIKLKNYAYSNNLVKKLNNVTNKYWEVSPDYEGLENECIENDWVN